MRYFEALKVGIDGVDGVGGYSGMLQPIAFSCMCHLIKRIILQDSESLKGPPAHIVLPLLVDRFNDSKPSLRTTSKRVFEDYWIACPNDAELVIRNVGFTHRDEMVRLECIQMLVDRIQMMQEKRFVFRPFTGSVVVLLSDESEGVRKASYDLLVSFFKSAHIKAKQDLSREMIDQGVSGGIQSKILREIGIEGEKVERPVSVNSFRNGVNVNGSSRLGKVKGLISSGIGGGNGGSLTANSQNTFISLITDSDGYKMDEMNAEDISSPDILKSIVEDMLPVFDGKETEFNWIKREKNIIRLRSIIRGNSPADFPDTVIWIFKNFSDGIVKAISTLRTSLSTHGCQLVKDVCMTMKHLFDPVIEPYLSNLIRITQGAKKISAQVAATVINNLIINSSYSVKFLNHIQLIVNDKVPQAKVFAATWARLIIACHGTKQNSKHYIESSGGDLLLEKCITKGLVDANPAVREGMRLAFWDFHSVFNKQGEAVLNKLDSTTKKTLERSRPQGISISTHAPLKVTRAAPTASRPGIRDFIAKSREAGGTGGVNREPVILVPTKSLTRLRAANSTVTSSLRKNIGTSMSTNAGVGVNSNSNAGSSASWKSTTGKSEEIVDLPSQSVSELLHSHDDLKFINGVRALTYLVRGKEPSSDIKCRRPANLPSPDIIDKSLRRVFSFYRDDSVSFNYLDLVKSFCNSEIIGSVLQFVGVENILYGASFSLEGLELEKSFHALNHLLISPEAFIILVDLLGEGRNRGAIAQLLGSVSERLDVSSGDKVREAIEKLSLMEFQDEEKETVDEVFTVLKDKGLVADESDIEDVEIANVDENVVDDVADVETDAVDVKHDADVEDVAEVAEIAELDESVGERVEEFVEGAVIKSEEYVRADVNETAQEDVQEIGQETAPEIISPEATPVGSLEDILDTPSKLAKEEIKEEADDVEMSTEDDNEHHDGVQVVEAEDEPTNSPHQLEDEQHFAESHVEESYIKEMPDEVEVREVTEYEQAVVYDMDIIDQTDEVQAIIPAEPIAPAHPADSSSSSIGVSGISHLTLASNDTDSIPPSPPHATITTSPQPPKLSIFEDSEPNSSSNTPQKPQFNLQTPIKLRENVNSKSILPWHSMAINKNICLSPLPQTDEDANQLYQSLINQMESKTIDSHGLRKLITIVKGVKSSQHESSSLPAYTTWRKGKWLNKLQKTVLKYLSFDNLSENEINQSLLLVYQLLEVEPNSFDGFETELMKSFASIAGISNSIIIGLGPLTDTRSLLISKCIRDGKDNINLRIKMIQCLTENWSNNHANNGVITFLILTLSELISSSIDKSKLEHALQSKLPSISSIILAYIGHDESRIRKETYPLLVNLRRLLLEDRNQQFLEQHVIQQMSVGQKQLLDFFCQK